MKFVMGRRKVLLVIIGLIIFVLLIVVLLYFLVLRKDDPDSNSQESNNTNIAEQNNIVIKDFGTEPIEKILNKYKDNPEMAYMFLTTEAGKKSYVNKYEEAIAYYKAAADLKGVSQTLRDEANLNVYYLAKKANNQPVVDEYTKLLGDKISNQANSVNGAEVKPSEDKE